MSEAAVARLGRGVHAGREWLGNVGHDSVWIEHAPDPHADTAYFGWPVAARFTTTAVHADTIAAQVADLRSEVDALEVVVTILVLWTLFLSVHGLIRFISDLLVK